MRRISLFWLVLACQTVLLCGGVAGCTIPSSAADQAKVGVILQEVIAEYEKPGFAVAMKTFAKPYDQLQYALSLQEMVAARHGMTYLEYIRALNPALADPQVQSRLARVKELIKSNQKIDERFSKTLEKLEEKGTIAPD
ncbi:MAG: DUF2184 domain-containing protein [Myxococcales bacterium]|nr:DUF2184 domain-containing protein [Myxococcales bacterium]